MDVLFWILAVVVVGQGVAISRMRSDLQILKAWNAKLAKTTADHAVYLEKTDPGWQERTLLYR